MYISEKGRAVELKFTAEEEAVKACLRVLESVGFSIPTFSSMMMQAINVDMRQDCARFCASLAENNRDYVVSHCFVQITMFPIDYLALMNERFCSHHFIMPKLTG